jgi:sec-independent protein translocase protein TatB
VGSVGAPELLVIFLVALIVLGPDKLPGAARQAGKFLGEARRMMAGLESEVKSAMRDDPMASAFKDVVGSVRGTISDATAPSPGEPAPPVQPPSLPVPEDPSRN